VHAARGRSGRLLAGFGTSSRMRRLVAAAALTAPLLATACTSTSTSTPPPSTGQLTPVYGTHAVNSPGQVTLSLIKDSSGQGPAAGAGVEILFAPKGVAEFLALSDSDELSYEGTWSLQSGKVTLAFTSSDFTRHGTFPLTYTSAPVTIPFEAFTDTKGSSSWEVIATDPVAGALEMAYATAASSDGTATADDAISAAANFAGSVTGAPVADAPPASESGATSPTSGGAGQIVEEADTSCVPTVAQVLKGSDNITLRMSCGASVVIPLVAPGGDIAGAGGPLSPGLFANIPNINLNPKSPGNANDDARTKRALFFMPFAGDLTPTIQVTPSGPVTLTIGGFAKENNTAISALSLSGYDASHPLIQANATVANLIAAFSNGTPGFIYIDSHGDSNGDLFTADFLGTTVAAADKSVARIAKTTGIPAADMWDGYIEIGANSGLSLPSGGRGKRPYTRAYMLTLRPAFWSWLESTHGADFSRSLVYVSACDTDQTATLRNTIKARAYFAFKTPITAALTSAVGTYLAALMHKATFTAEETYYNMLRIDSQRTTVYDEDHYFDGILDSGGVSSRSSDPLVTEAGIVNVLDGYGSDGGAVVTYRDNGWLTSGVSEGQVFYLLTAARAGSAEDTKHGIANLKTCWVGWWSGGHLPGLASPYCQQWNNGSAPTQDEYYYSVYLLSGQDMGFSGTKVPRFTLNDGA
jgi:hypothetical protein